MRKTRNRPASSILNETSPTGRPERIDPKVRGSLAASVRLKGEKSEGEAFEDLREFITDRTTATLARCDSRGEALAVHRLNLRGTLNETLLSTNAIENVTRNGRDTNREREALDCFWDESGFTPYQGDITETSRLCGRPSGVPAHPSTLLRPCCCAPRPPQPPQPPQPLQPLRMSTAKPLATPILTRQ